MLGIYKLAYHNRCVKTLYCCSRSAIKNGTNVNIISKRSIKILGIETSCDDTGCAIVDEKGNILGEALQTQQETHLDNGGIIPPLARDLHKAAIQNVVDRALQAANLKLQDLDAIATTVKPGLPLSLVVGMKYGKHLCKIAKKPFIPIHHMEAHALTIRMVDEVAFPFLVLLISGGHSLIAVVKSATDFHLLGESRDDAPGEAFDKVSRRLKLRNFREFRSMSGGQAVETAAARGDPKAYRSLAVPMLIHKDCDFSFSGFKNSVKRIITDEEKKYDVMGGQTIPLPIICNICASLQHSMTTHICHRVQRAMEYVRLKELISPDKQILVVSGGVACNKYIQEALRIVCNVMDYEIRVPPPHLCTDNGIMIAWNGIERWQTNQGVYQNGEIDSVDIIAKCPLGQDLRQDVKESSIKCKWIQWDKISKVNRHDKANIEKLNT